MAKNAVTDWDETASNNTDIGGIDIDEGCAPSGINNAIRTVMSQLRAFFKANMFRIRDNTDQTKLLAFDVSGVTTGTTRTLAAPDASGTIAITTRAIMASEVQSYFTEAQRARARANLGADILTGLRNQFMNGTFVVRERVTPASIAPGSLAFVADRVQVLNTTDKTLNVSIVGAQAYSISTDVGNALSLSFASAPTTGTVVVLEAVEDVRTLQNMPATLSVFVLENAWGAFGGYIDQNFGSGGSSAVSAATYTFGSGTGVKSAVATLPAMTSKTLGTGHYLNVGFTFTPRSAGVLAITKLALVAGDATTESDPSAPRPVALERMLCRRYARRIGARAIVTAAATGDYFQTETDVSDMRTTPTISATSTADALTNCGTPDAAIAVIGSSLVYRVFAQSSASGFAAFSAERLLSAEF